jgi:hypothetical protein
MVTHGITYQFIIGQDEDGGTKLLLACLMISTIFSNIYLLNKIILLLKITKNASVVKKLPIAKLN